MSNYFIIVFKVDIWINIKLSIFKDNSVNFLGHNEEARANIFKNFYGLNNNHYRCKLEDFRLSMKLSELIGESMVKKNLNKEINIENNIAVITDKDVLGI